MLSQENNMGKLLNCTLEIYGKYMGNIREIYGKYTRNIREIYGKYMGNIWEIYGKYCSNTVLPASPPVPHLSCSETLGVRVLSKL